MGFVANTLTPIITVTFITGFFAWIIYLIYKGLRSIFPSFKYFFKYQILKRPYDHDVAEWCIKTIQKDIDSVEAMKLLLFKGYPMNHALEVIYIYKSILKKMKGGLNGREYRRSNETPESQHLPKFG